MSKYTFTFKKDDIFVEFSTSDKETVERQFQIWVADADAYAKQGTKEINGERETGNTEASLREVSTLPTEKVLNVPFEEMKKNEAPSTKIEATAEEFAPIKEPQPEVLDQASTLLKTINAIQETGNRKQETNEANSKQQTANSEPESPAANFDTVLEKSLENPTFEPAKPQDKLFLNLVNSKNTTDKFHYLIITAYYLSEFEKQQRFSLKQINSKMMQNLSEVIDHSTLQDAINQNYIEVVPDLTGVSDVAEYKLTLLGEEFFANRI